MARWILDRPAEFSNKTELQVAECLAELSDDWVIRWGFLYVDGREMVREGDFLILGPKGGLLVMEVKGGRLNHLTSSGRWSTDNGDHPVSQLMTEWRAVVDRVGTPCGDYPPLFVEKVLALPQVQLGEEAAPYLGIERRLIFTHKDLKNFPDSWNRLFSTNGAQLDGRQRTQFFRTYGAEATAKAVRYFITETERVFRRQAEANYSLLNQLQENQQFLVRGGTGTGKTWLAFELACRWAEETEGEVLFLCYNLAFAHQMAELAAVAKKRWKPKKGNVVVRSWEALAATVLEAAGGSDDPPVDLAERTEFFMETVPKLLVDAVREGLVEERFAALVVDEAQDHNTRLIGETADWVGPGWWGVYWAMLRGGREGRVAVFYDAAQRPVFRETDAFDPEELVAALPRAVQVQLQNTVRYTDPIFTYLESLGCDATRPLLAGISRSGGLPEGPDVRVVAVEEGFVLNAVEKILSEWIGSGFCKAEEVLLLSPHANPVKSVAGGLDQIGEWRVVDYLDRKPGCVSRTSVNKAKGLDSLAVILIDFPEFEEIRDPGLQVAFFMGASRARQLLAVVVDEKVESSALDGT